MNSYIQLHRISKGTYGETFKVKYNNNIFCKKKYLVDKTDIDLTDDYIK